MADRRFARASLIAFNEALDSDQVTVKVRMSPGEQAQQLM